MNAIIEQIIREIYNQQNNLKGYVDTIILDIDNEISQQDLKQETSKQKDNKFCIKKLFCKRNNEEKTSSDKSSQDFLMLKDEITNKIIDTAKRISNDWENFIEPCKRKIQDSIEHNDIDISTKDAMLSRTYISEIIDISLIDISSSVDIATDTNVLKERVFDCKQLLINAIDKATDKQIETYRTLLE